MKLNKTLFLVLLFCVPQIQAIDFSQIWKKLDNSSKLLSKTIVIVSAVYLARKFINSLNSFEQEVQKNKVEEPLNDNQEAKVNAELVDLNQEPVNYFIPKKISSYDVIDLHYYVGHSKFEQLIQLFPCIGHVLLDAKMTSNKINMSKVSILGKTIKIQLSLETYSRIVIIKQKDDYSYELVSNDTVYHEPILNAF